MDALWYKCVVAGLNVGCHVKSLDNICLWVGNFLQFSKISVKYFVVLYNLVGGYLLWPPLYLLCSQYMWLFIKSVRFLWFSTRPWTTLPLILYRMWFWQRCPKSYFLYAKLTLDARGNIKSKETVYQFCWACKRLIKTKETVYQFFWALGKLIDNVRMYESISLEKARLLLYNSTIICSIFGQELMMMMMMMMRRLKSLVHMKWLNSLYLGCWLSTEG